MKTICGMIVFLFASLAFATANPFADFIGEYKVTNVDRCRLDRQDVNGCELNSIKVWYDQIMDTFTFDEIDGYGTSVGFALSAEHYENSHGTIHAELDRPFANAARWFQTGSFINGTTTYESRVLMKNAAGDFVYRYTYREVLVFGDERSLERVYQLQK